MKFTLHTIFWGPLTQIIRFWGKEFGFDDILPGWSGKELHPQSSEGAWPQSGFFDLMWPCGFVWTSGPPFHHIPSRSSRVCHTFPTKIEPYNMPVHDYFHYDLWLTFTIAIENGRRWQFIYHSRMTRGLSTFYPRPKLLLRLQKKPSQLSRRPSVSFFVGSSVGLGKWGMIMMIMMFHNESIHLMISISIALL